MGNCTQSHMNGYDEKNTVDSQDVSKPQEKKYNSYNPQSKKSKNDIPTFTNIHQEDIKQNVKSENRLENKDSARESAKQNYQSAPDYQYTFIKRPAPNFSGMAYFNKGFKKISLRDYKGQYVVLFFFPYDFSELSRKEILAFSELNDKFVKAACQVIGCSQDSQFAHMIYCQKPKTEGGLGNLEIPLLSDVDKQISTSYGVVIEDGEAGEKGECAAFKSTFIIDSNQILRHMSINDISISINPEEILRLVHTFQQHDRENPLKQQMTGGCPFNHNAKEDIDTFSRYQRKKSADDQSNKNESAKQSNQSKRSHSNQNNDGKNEEKQIPLIIRLGGDEVVQDIADRFVNEIFGDQDLKKFFLNKTSQSKQKRVIGQFLKTYFGSRQLYQGRNMQEAHKDLGLNDDHFNKASEFFKRILKEDLKLKPQLVQEVMMLIEPLRSQITQKPSESLYNRVNKEEGIRKAVKYYFNKILQLNEIKPIFSKVDTNQVQEQYVQYLSLVFGGPSKYKGKQMREAHSHAHISEKVFTFCCAQIQQGFKENGVDTHSINEIGRLLECLRSEIPKKNNTLYDRLGGIVVIEKAVKKLYEEKLMNVHQLKDFFNKVDMKQLSQKMTDYYIMICGGPNRFKGKSAKEAHSRFTIMSSQFEIYKNLLKESFTECGSTKESIIEFMNLIDTIKVDIVGGKPPSLFERIGGDDFLTLFTEKFFDKIMEEKRIRHYFINVELPQVKKHFKDYINMASGGSTKYQGQNVRDHHEQMDISEKDFNVFMEVLKKTLEQMQLKQELEVEFLNFFENMRNMIVSEYD
ncbi:hypothetical protein ABPG72_015631 [Tetrahymena utriculariae]